jgi:hypothetical protein
VVQWYSVLWNTRTVQIKRILSQLKPAEASQLKPASQALLAIYLRRKLAASVTTSGWLQLDKDAFYLNGST